MSNKVKIRLQTLCEVELKATAIRAK